MKKSHPKEISSTDFKQEVLESALPVILDMWAPWCMPCRMIAPILEQLAEENNGKIKVCKVNTDDNQHIAAHYSIQSIPTLLFFKNGKEVDRLVGVNPKPVIQEKINTLL